MDSAKTWGEAITVALIDIGQKFIYFFPKILGSILILFVGWIIAVTLGRLVAKMVNELGIDRLLKSVDSRNDSKLTIFAPSVLVGGLFKWFLALVFLMAVTNILGLNQVSVFLNSIVVYLPNVFVAIIILTFVVLLGNFTYHIVKTSMRAAGVVSALFLATLSKWAIVVFGIFAALIQLGIASTLVNTIFIGVVAMFSLAGGLAFGLGGKEEAQLILRKLREELTEKHK